MKELEQYYYKKPSALKLIQLLSTENVSELCRFGKYLDQCAKLTEKNAQYSNYNYYYCYYYTLVYINMLFQHENLICGNML